MTVTFTLTPDDHVASILYRMNANPIVGRPRSALGLLFRMVLVLSLVGAMGLQVAMLVRGGGWNPAVIAGCLGLAVTGYHLLFLNRKLEQQIRKQVRQQQAEGKLDHILGEQRFELRAHEFVVATRHETVAVAWSAVEKIVTTRDYAFFHHGEYGLRVLPKHAFEWEEDFAKFVETARMYREAEHRSGAAAVRPEEPTAGIARQPGGVVEVFYKLTPEDGLEVFRQSALRSRSGLAGSPRQRVATALVLLGFLAFLVAPNWQAVVAANRAGGGGFALVALLVPALLVPLIIVSVLAPSNPLALRLLKRILAKQRCYGEATHRLRLTPDTLIYAVDSEVKAMPWRQVEKIIVTTGHAFFCVRGVEMVILPKRAFAHEPEFGDFVETAARYHQAATPTAA